MKLGRKGTESGIEVAFQIVIGGIVDDGPDVEKVWVAAQGFLEKGPIESLGYGFGNEPVGDLFRHVLWQSYLWRCIKSRY
jgi:hypothetical protein